MVYCAKVGGAQRQATSAASGKPLLVEEGLIRLLILDGRGHLVCADVGLGSAQPLTGLVRRLTNACAALLLLLLGKELALLGANGSRGVRPRRGHGHILSVAGAASIDAALLSSHALLIRSSMHGVEDVPLTRDLIQGIVRAAFKVVRLVAVLR